jgi:hypothetical protein
VIQTNVAPDSEGLLRAKSRRNYTTVEISTSFIRVVRREMCLCECMRWGRLARTIAPIATPIAVTKADVGSTVLMYSPKPPDEYHQ